MTLDNIADWNKPRTLSRKIAFQEKSNAGLTINPSRPCSLRKTDNIGNQSRRDWFRPPRITSDNRRSTYEEYQGINTNKIYTNWTWRHSRLLHNTKINGTWGVRVPRKKTYCVLTYVWKVFCLKFAQISLEITQDSIWNSRQMCKWTYQHAILRRLRI